MKIITTRVHGIIDYLAGIFLIISPWLFNFAHSDSDTWVPVVMGNLMIIYSLLTNYELGFFPLISMKNHLRLDAAGAVFLIASPWLFNFSDYIFIPHVVIGVLELIAVSMTNPNPVIQNHNLITGKKSHQVVH